MSATSAGQSARRNLHLTEWHQSQRPSLERILIAGLSLASGFEDYRGTLLAKREIERIDASAVDVLGMIYDQISDGVGAAQKTGDELGIETDFFTLDMSELEAAHAKWKARSEAGLKPLSQAVTTVLARAAE